MQERSLQIAKEHWGQILDCAPSKIFEKGINVTSWDSGSVEFLLWEDGAVVGVPERLLTTLREQIRRVPFDLTCDDARQIVEPTATVDEVLGPQFVGYCDQTTFAPVDSDARRIEPGRLKTLRDACPVEEWTRSALQIEEKDRPTFAVLRDGQPIAATQISTAHGVAGFATITHPAYRNRGHGKSVVSRAVEAAFERDLLPEYRTVERWPSSVALAEQLGFKQVARSVLVQLPEHQ